MATSDYKRGLKGSKPDLFDFGSDRKDVERGYRDHLRNQELANTIRGQSDSSPTVSGSADGSSFFDNFLTWLGMIFFLVPIFGGAALGFQLFGVYGAIIFGIIGFVLAPFLLQLFFMFLIFFLIIWLLPIIF